MPLEAEGSWLIAAMRWHQELRPAEADDGKGQSGTDDHSGARHREDQRFGPGRMTQFVARTSPIIVAMNPRPRPRIRPLRSYPARVSQASSQFVFSKRPGLPQGTRSLRSFQRRDYFRTRKRRMVTAPDRVLLTGSRSILARPGG